MNTAALAARIKDLMEEAYHAGFKAGRGLAEWEHAKAAVESELYEAVNQPDAIPADF